MKKLDVHFFVRFVCILFVSNLIFQSSQAQGITFFEGSWDQLKAKAKAEHKAIFVDCYTSWCGPCKMMASRVFPQKEVGDFYNASFINYSIDMEKGEGPALAPVFNIKFYPTFIYFSPDGEIMHRVSGGMQPDAFIQEGKIAFDPQKSYSGHIKRFKKGEKDTTFLLEVIEQSRYSDEQLSDKALELYWKTVPKSELVSPINWARFKVLDNSVRSVQYQYVTDHKQSYVQIYGDEEVTKTLLEKAAYSLQHAAEIRDLELMKKSKAILDSSHIEEITKFAALGELVYYKSTSDLTTFGTLARKYINRYAIGNADELNNMAFEVANGIDDKTLLQDAEKWVQESIKIKKGYQNMDIYAHILYKLGKNKEAIQTANEALEIAKRDNIDPKQTQELLGRIK